MSLSRRALLIAGPALALVSREAAAAPPDNQGGFVTAGPSTPASPSMPARATIPASAAALPASSDPRMGERALGSPTAKLVVQEWFSLTCTHCARFSQVVFPEVKAKLIDTGRIRYVFQDFPLDQVALTASMVARALPEDRYAPFVESLLASQDRWAFAQGVDSRAELAKMAALAGLGRESFQRTVDDQALRTAIVAKQDAASKQYGIEATPTFIFGKTSFSGEMDYDTFAKQVAAAGG